MLSFIIPKNLAFNLEKMEYNVVIRAQLKDLCSYTTSEHFDPFLLICKKKTQILNTINYMKIGPMLFSSYQAEAKTGTRTLELLHYNTKSSFKNVGTK